MLALVLQPVLAAVGEIHEQGHGSAAAHAVFDASQGAAAAPQDR